MPYFDYAATTPVSPDVAAEMVEVMTKHFGNPSSQHGPGRYAKALVDECRTMIATVLGCRNNQLYFTSGGTESNNWAIRAALHQNRRVGKHIITSAVEHSAVLQCMKALEQEGYEVTYLKPDGTGRISVDQVSKALREDTALVSIMLVNNEVGIRYPIDEIATLLRIKQHPALLHTDAVQAFMKVPFTAKSLSADFISISAHKVGGPKGIGALYVGGNAKAPQPLLYGGGQEFGFRSGTEPVSQIVGFSKAVELRYANLDAILSHVGSIHAYALDRLAAIPDLVVISEGDAPHILCVSLPGYPSENIVSDLDSRDIYISAGSACHRGKASHVFTAMGMDKRTAAGTIRISFSEDTTRGQVDALFFALLSHQTSRFPML